MRVHLNFQVLFIGFIPFLRPTAISSCFYLESPRRGKEVSTRKTKANKMNHKELAKTHMVHAAQFRVWLPVPLFLEAHWKKQLILNTLIAQKIVGMLGNSRDTTVSKRIHIWLGYRRSGHVNNANQFCTIVLSYFLLIYKVVLATDDPELHVGVQDKLRGLGSLYNRI